MFLKDYLALKKTIPIISEATDMLSVVTQIFYNPCKSEPFSLSLLQS